MGATGIVVVQIGGQAYDEFLSRSEVAAFEETTSQGAEPQFDLVEPGSVLGREVEDMLVTGIGQEGASLRAGTQVFFVKGKPLSCARSWQTSRLQWVFKLSRTQWKRWWSVNCDAT